jgi:hypothetical protein
MVNDEEVRGRGLLPSFVLVGQGSSTAQDLTGKRSGMV